MPYRFPSSTEDNNYEARVTFTPMSLKSFDVTSVLPEQKRGTTANPSAEAGFGVNPADAAAGYNTRPNSVSGGRAAQAFTEQVFAFFGTLNQTVPGTRQQIEQIFTNRAVTLYLPQAVQITDAAQYDNIDLGILGAGTLAGVQSGIGISEALGKAAANTLTDIYKAFNTDGLGTAAGRLAQARAAQMFLPNGGALQGAVRSGTRVAVNPNTRALFRSVPLREFTFTFKLIPNSSTEHDQIKNIIRIFREELYPTPIEVGTGPIAIAAGYEYPNVFDITLSYNNIRHAIATRILPCYLRNFSATYNSSSMGFHENGEFSEVDISMTFVESSSLNKELVERGY